MYRKCNVLSLLSILSLWLIYNISTGYALNNFKSESVLVDVNIKKDVLYPGDSTDGEIKIKSNYTSPLTLFIDLYAVGREGWFSWDKSKFTLLPHQEVKKNIQLFIPQTAEEGRHYYYIYLKYAENGEILKTLKKSFYVLARPLIEITNVGVKYPAIKPNSTQYLYIHISNIGELKADKYSILVKIQEIGFYKRYFPISLDVGEKDIIRVEIPIEEKEAPRSATVIVEMYDERGKLIEQKEIGFEIIGVEKIDEKIEEKHTLFVKYLNINATNIGNTKTVYTYTLSSPGFLWMYEFEGATPLKRDSTYVIKCELDVGESCTFTIKINYWIAYIILIVVLTLLILIFITFTSPKVVKSYYIKGHRYIVTLKIINHKTKDLRDVILKDHVKGIFIIDEESILPKPSKIHKVKDGYVIEWKIGTLKKGESRIFRYEIIPKISVIGEIKLESATLEGKDKRGKKYKIKS